MKYTSERKPSEVIANIRLSDSGLQVIFGDNVTAVLPFSDLKRVTESKSILWDEIQISEDRSYISVGVKGLEAVPVPHDVLREFISSEKEQRQKEYSQQKKLTAKFLGKRIRLRRETSGMSQEGLALKAGISRWSIIRVEKGEYLPKIAVLGKIARGLGLQIEELLG